VYDDDDMIDDDRLVYLEALFAAKAELQRFTEIISL
jgi:hypothetical protein